MKRIYLASVYVLLNIVVLFGFLAPYLLSAKSDILPILGIALIIADALHLLLFVTKEGKNAVSFFKLNKNQNEKK